MISEKTGTLPTTVLDRSMSDFWLNYEVLGAWGKFQKEEREKRRGGGGPGAATQREREKLVEENEQRADQREAMEEAGMKAPSVDGQASRMDELRDDPTSPFFDGSEEERLERLGPDDVDDGSGEL